MKYFFFAVLLFASSLAAQENDSLRGQLVEGLKYKPIQADVDYDSPAADEVALCSIALSEDKSGFVITGPQKNILRTFLDTNGDGQVDQWSYFKNGVEVYRDIDSDGDKKADQFRWLNTAGTRWGADLNGDKKIDVWKKISAEEVSREIVLAVATGDTQRLLNVSLGEAELKSLALGKTLNSRIEKKTALFKEAEVLEASFKNSGLQQGDHWLQLNAAMPSVIPADEKNNKSDLTVYENCVVTVGSSAGKPKQLTVGTLIKIADGNWRVLDLPRTFDENQPLFTFIQPPAAQNSTGQPNTEVMELMNEVQDLRTKVHTLPVAERTATHKAIIASMIKIVAKSSTAEERENWIRNLADTIMDATGRKEFPQGSEQMKVLFDSVNKPGNEELAAHVRSRQIMTDYYTAMNSGQDDMDAFKKYLDHLEEFAKNYEKTESGVEGMLQLASYREMTARSNEEPLKWYVKVAELAKDTAAGKKAAGAIRRLTAAGKEVAFKTTDVSGKPFDIADHKGKAVLLVFWDSRTATELAAIKAVVEKAEVLPIGINLDSDAKTMNTAAAKAGLTWTQLYTPGGLDSAIGSYWGLTGTPSMMLYGKDGKVIQTNIQNAAELQQILTSDE